MTTKETMTGTKMEAGTIPRKPSVVWSAMKTVKTKLSLTDEGASPVNWKVIFLVFISLVSHRSTFFYITTVFT